MKLSKKRNIRIIAVISLFVLFAFSRLPAQVIEHCLADIEMKPDQQEHLRDATVTLKMTYRVSAGDFIKDFKEIGEENINMVTMKDEDNHPVSFEIEYPHETRSGVNKISWSAYVAHAGHRTLILRFNIANVLRGTEDENRVHFEWLNTWNIPVEATTIRFILPGKEQYEIPSSSPVAGEIKAYQGKRVYEMKFVGATSKDFEILVSPGFAKPQVFDKKGKGMSFFDIAFLVIFVVVIVVVVIRLDISPWGRKSRSMSRTRLLR
jgi:hypothetical protein